MNLKYFLLSLLLSLVIFTSSDYTQQEERTQFPQLTRDKSLFPLQSTGIWTEVHPLIPRVDYWGVFFVNADTGWAVGEGGAIIKTTNGGQKWIWYESGVENTLRTAAAVNNGQRVIAAGDGGIILISEDAGESWGALSSGTTDNIWNMQMITGQIGWMVGEGGTALKTSDGGFTWIQQSTPYPNLAYWDVSFINTSFGYICCNSAIVLKTTNGGANWQIQQAGDTRNLFTIYAFDTLRASAGGFAGKIVYTTDGGNTWLNATGAYAEANKIKFIDDTLGFLAANGGFYESTNGGISWFSKHDLYMGSDSAPSTNLSFPEGSRGYVTGTNMLLAKTTNNGGSWKRTIVNADFINVYFKDEHNGFMNSSHSIYTTKDGGYTVDTLITFPYSEAGSMEAMTFTDSSTGFIGTGKLKIYKTTNSGLSWYRTNINGLTDTTGTLRKIFFLNANLGYAALGGKILKTIDGGENWYIVLSAPFTSFSGISNSTDSTIWTVGTNTYPFEIYKSIDQGENWISITVSFMDMSDVYFRNKLNGFIIGSNKLFKTSDGGNSWFQDNQITTYTLNFKAISAYHFIITGNIYESIDTGNTWINITEEIGTGFINLYAPYNYFCVPVGKTGFVMNYTDTTIVPVELLGFTGQANNLKVFLSWKTITEKNNYGFEIQRSTNKIDWEKIGFVSREGTTTEMQRYSFEDSDIKKQIYYYRLKQLDYNSLFKYSDIIEVKILLNNFELFQNYPDPFNPVTSIKYDLPNTSDVSLIIYDILGRKVNELVNTKQEAGRYEIQFNASGLASGVYIYQLITDKYVNAKKMILLK